MLDSNTLIFKGLYEAHNCEVAAVYFYDKEKQLVSLALDGDLSLWDAQKMQVLQTVHNRQNMHGVNQINASFFCRQSTTMLLATNRVLLWSLKEDTTKKVEIEQQEAVAKDFLTQFRKGLTRQGVLLNVDPPLPAQVSMSQLLQNKQQFVQAIYRGDSPGLQQVLPSTKTELVGCFVVKEFVFTVDMHCLLRQWSLATGKCLHSQPLEMLQETEDVSAAFRHKHRI